MDGAYSQGADSRVRAAAHLFIPMHTPDCGGLRRRAIKSGLWSIAEPDTRFYMRYIERIFKASDNAGVMTASCPVLHSDAAAGEIMIGERTIAVTGARLYCFDTSIALLKLALTFECESLAECADICAELRKTDYTILHRKCGGEYTATTLNRVAEGVLENLGDYTLFPHLGEKGATRGEMLTVVVADESETDKDINICRIANGLNSKGDTAPQGELFSYLPHIRWAISGKGACSLGLLTQDEKNRDFVQNKWMSIVEERHIIWYILTLHQKYAMFQYLGDIAEKGSLAELRKFQQKIVQFNTGYRFEIVSEDTSYQVPYRMARDAKAVESVFADIDEEIRRLSEHHNTAAEKNNVIAMTVVSLACAISTFIDIYEMSAAGESVGEILRALSAVQIAMFAVILAAMATAIALLVVRPIAKLILPYVKKFFTRIYSRIFLR